MSLRDGTGDKGKYLGYSSYRSNQSIKSALDLLSKPEEYKHTKPPQKGQNLLGAEEKLTRTVDQPGGL